MKEEIKDLSLSNGLIGVGVYARAILGGKKYSAWQLAALIGVGIGIVFILNETTIAGVYQKTICLVYGLVSPNLLNAIIKAANKSEDKTAEKLSDKIDKLT
jgi:multisubunit Na+/H+ antiporter MnhG subunit